MKLKIPYMLLCVLLLLPAGGLKAQDYAASLRVSSVGLNLEGIRTIGDNFDARLGFAWFNYNSLKGGGSSSDEYRYTGELNLMSISALGDWFPFTNSIFRISAGIFVNLNKASMTLTPTKSKNIGGDVYTPDKLGNLSVDINFPKVAPYIGIGLGNPTSGGSGLKFSFDIGTFYQGPPSANLSASGLIEPSAAPDQEQQLNENLSWFKWYPVIALGIIYKF